MTDIRKLQLNLLVAFDALMDQRSVTRAASQLSLTQQTVSGMLARLRVLFDDPLFVRTQRGIVPTPRADALAPAIKTLIADAETIIAPDTFDPATTTMTLRVMAHDYLLYTLMAPFITELKRAAPKMNIAVMPSYVADLPDRLRDGTVDLAITLPQHARADGLSRLLFVDRYVGAVRTGHPLKSRKPSLAEFCRWDHALVSPDGGGFSGPVDAALAARAYERNVVVSFNNYRLLLDTLRYNDLIAVVPAFTTRGSENIFRLFEPPVALPELEVTAYWHPRVSTQPGHAWSRKILAGVAERLSSATKISRYGKAGADPPP